MPEVDAPEGVTNVDKTTTENPARVSSPFFSGPPPASLLDHSLDFSKEQAQLSDIRASLQEEIGTSEIEESEFPSHEELLRAKKGVDEFKEIFGRSSPEIERELVKGEVNEQVQSVFLGLKPAFDTTIAREREAADRLPLPDRFHYAGSLLYDEELAKQKIEQNLDIFTDFNPETDDVNQYLQQLNERNPVDGAASRDDTAKIGLLLGYPKQSVLDYARYNPHASDFYNQLRRMYRNRTFESDPTEEELQIARNFLLLDSEGHADNSEETGERLDQYKLTHKEEYRAFLQKHFPDLRPPGMDRWLVNIRGVNVHGFNYGDSSGNSDDSSFISKVKRTYEASGMNAFLEKSKQKTEKGEIGVSREDS